MNPQTLHIRHGDRHQATVTILTEGTTPLDLTGATLGVEAASDTRLAAVTPSIEDAAQGRIRFWLDEATTRGLSGKSNHLVLAADFGPGQERVVLPTIHIEASRL